MRLIERLTGLALLIVIAGCGDSAAPPPTVTERLDRQVGQLLQLQPEQATYYAVPLELTDGPINNRLSDYSPAAEAEIRSLIKGFVEEIDALDRDGLSEQDQLSLDVARTVYSNMAASARFPYGRQYPFGFIGHTPFVANQLSAAVVDVPNIMASQQAVGSLEEARDYVERLKDFGRSYDTLIEKISADAEAGAIPPRILIDRTRAVIAEFIGVPATENTLYQSLARKADEAGIEAGYLIEQAATVIEEVVYPAFRRVDTALEGLRERAPADAGIWQQPDGAAYYQTQITALGDSTLSADDIHQIGLDEVARILAQMDRILKGQGLEDGSVAERMRALARDRRFIYPDSDQGREDLLSYVRTVNARMLARVPDYFERIPPQSVVIKRIPEFSQDSAPDGYYDSPSLDGTRPGIYWINLRNMAEVVQWSLPTLTYHEAVPGHHFQIATALSLENIPLIRKLAPFNAYVEGWALYAERLAHDMGAYDDDPYGDLGRLRDELFRAARLVVDTGMHHKRWSREEAIGYMVQTVGTSRSAISPEIERYMAWPGQALGYKLGQLKISELRDRAMLALGEGFDIRRFHSILLEAGQLPLTLLEARVERWISEREALIGGS